MAIIEVFLGGGIWYNMEKLTKQVILLRCCVSGACVERIFEKSILG